MALPGRSLDADVLAYDQRPQDRGDDLQFATVRAVLEVEFKLRTIGRARLVLAGSLNYR
jgi:hypothetical protein